MKNTIAALPKRVGGIATIALALTVATPTFAQDMDFGGEELLVQTYGGTLAIYFRDVFVKEFNERYNANVEVEEGLSSDTVAKLRAARGVPHVDVFMVTKSWASVLEAEGLTEPLSLENVPELANIEPAARDEGDDFVRFCRTSMTIAYNTNELSVEDLPATWSDLADPKYKGKLTLPVPGNAHTIMLMARLADLTTGSVENVDPAIAELQKIADNTLTYWTSFDQAFSLLNSGETPISVNSTDRTIDQALKGAPVATYYPAEGTTFISNTVGIAKGTEHAALAEAWINFLLEQEQQGQIASNLGFSVVRSDVEVAPEVAALLPSAEVTKASLMPDWADLGNRQAEWIERYTKKVASR